MYTKGHKIIVRTKGRFIQIVEIEVYKIHDFLDPRKKCLFFVIYQVSSQKNTWSYKYEQANCDTDMHSTVLCVID